ncbi:MAG: pantoate--beta-alanine ligase [Ferrimicrobium sp.]
MEVYRAAREFSQAMDGVRATGGSVGLVPTMGALHAGHESLVARASAECEHVAVTIFVNPMQFGDPDDIAHYPGTLPDDLECCARAGVASVWVPSVQEIYPDWPSPVTTVSVGGVSEQWEGCFRSGHFDGVSTVVSKLFSAAGRCRAYFGEKDFQQLVVVRRLVSDLFMPVDIIGCPTVREQDGLALSSRNTRLLPPQRRAATTLWRSLVAGRDAVAAGESSPVVVASLMTDVIASEPLAILDYAAVVNPVDLTVPTVLTGTDPFRLLIAARLGPVRLIDSCAASLPLLR